MNDMVKVMDRVSLPDIRKQRKAILELEEMILSEEQTHVEPIHTVHAGMYARTVTVPKGMMLTGAIYKFDHIEIMSSGKLLVTTDHGKSAMLEGFNIIPALSGKKRAAFAVEETTWTTVHNVGQTRFDGDKIQDYLTAETFEELEQFYATVNEQDFFQFCVERGFTPELVTMWSEINSDRIDLELKSLGVRVDDSIIGGKGIFANQLFSVGEKIMPARINGQRTQAGRYCNHALRANAKFENIGGDYHLVAIQPISADDEITVNYRDVFINRFETGDLCQE